jgi:rhamnose utilization protein RhaD (predicted bifunctional aldolase and dehydrogenase)
MVLMSHGIFSFGRSARESYERMVALVSRAQAYLEERNAWHIAWPENEAPTSSNGKDCPAAQGNLRCHGRARHPGNESD